MIYFEISPVLYRNIMLYVGFGFLDSYLTRINISINPTQFSEIIKILFGKVFQIKFWHFSGSVFFCETFALQNSGKYFKMPYKINFKSQGSSNNPLR